ncbi:MAG TPA: MBL fold metallo-hydrolase [Thermomicrobiales bacterium]|jgi:L-ascorbate metabolism protein UlaG (beta-lactamase superfamily)|nr:MBL fold metallo-hydrolase [Thermomicrobiales bacterium]
MAEFRWFGHNCIRLRAREATLLFDPVGRGAGYALPKQTADIVLLSNDDPANTNFDAVKPEYKIVRGPGEYELHEVFITGLGVHRTAPDALERTRNTAYLFEIEGLRVCHLGDLGHVLSTEQAEILSDVDVLLVPAGGAPLSAAQAAEVVGQLEPKVVVPVRYATAAGDKSLDGVEAFCKALGVAAPAAEDKLTLRPSDLTETMRIVALTPGG